MSQILFQFFYRLDNLKAIIDLSSYRTGSYCLLRQFEDK